MSLLFIALSDIIKKEMEWIGYTKLDRIRIDMLN